MGRASPGETFARNKRPPEGEKWGPLLRKPIDCIRWSLGPFCTCVCAKSFLSCWTLCHPVDCILPGSSVHGILRARMLEWVAMASSRGSSRPRDCTYISFISCIGRQVLYHYHHLGSPLFGSHLWECNRPPNTHGAVMSSDNRLRTVVLAGSGIRGRVSLTWRPRESLLGRGLMC